MKKKDYFPNVGLCADGTFTLLDGNHKDFFWSKSNMTNEDFMKLFQFASSKDGFWSNNDNWCLVEYDYLTEDKVPINPQVIGLKTGDSFGHALDSIEKI